MFRGFVKIARSTISNRRNTKDTKISKSFVNDLLNFVSLRNERNTSLLFRGKNSEGKSERSSKLRMFGTKINRHGMDRFASGSRVPNGGLRATPSVHRSATRRRDLLPHRLRVVYTQTWKEESPGVFYPRPNGKYE